MASVELSRAAIDGWTNWRHARRLAVVGYGDKRTLLATEVIFSVLICLCVMSDIRLSPSTGSQSCLQNPLSQSPVARAQLFCVVRFLRQLG
jgi:hypothetical protein